MSVDRTALYDLYAAYGGLIDAGDWTEWLALFAPECTYQVIPRENVVLGLPAGLVYCDSRAMLEDRIMALQEANKYNIHNDRHLVGLPRVIGQSAGGIAVEAPFAVYQSDQEGGSRLFATGLYQDRVIPTVGGLRFHDKTIVLDTFAVPTLLSTPL